MSVPSTVTSPMEPPSCPMLLPAFVETRRGAMTSTDLAHGLQRMTGRDPDEGHRAATPLELLFDLAFVVAFGAAGTELAHTYAENHVGAGLAAFGLSVFAICWAWINMAWFASAFDTDDWLYRLLTMVQMAGVIIVALGLPPLFASVVAGGDIDNRTMVAGYVVMRVPMVFHWLRAAKGHPARRKACRASSGWPRRSAFLANT